MGCESSQMTQPAPHEPHNMPPEQEDVKASPVKVESASPSVKDLPQDKENNGSRQASRKVSTKPVEANNISEAKRKSKSERQMEEVPMSDATNLQRDNLVLEDNKRIVEKRESKRLSARQITKEDDKAVGPSSKSIEKPLEDAPLETGVEEFPITNVLKESKKEVEEAKE